jgi:hypothetical protein
MKRYGTLITFKPGTTRAEAAATLDMIRRFASVENSAWVDGAGRQRYSPDVHEYDDDHGGPVWYIP